MSQRRVIVGTDDRGRPVSRWEDTPAEDAPYGHMEPAYESTVERRQATPDELAAAVARETPAGYLAAPKVVRNATGQTNAERMQASRMRGSQLSHEVVAATRATPTQHAWNGSGRHLPPVEEGTMDEPTTVPEDVIHMIRRTPSPLTALSDAAAIAHQKLEAVRVAQEAWEIARAALDKAMTECLTVIGSRAPREVESPPDDVPAPTLAVVSERVATEPRSRTHEGQHAGQTAARDRRAARVTEAVARHGGDQGAAAAELGMKRNAVAQIVKFAHLRSGVSA